MSGNFYRYRAKTTTGMLLLGASIAVALYLFSMPVDIHFWFLVGIIVAGFLFVAVYLFTTSVKETKNISHKTICQIRELIQNMDAKCFSRFPH